MNPTIRPTVDEMIKNSRLPHAILIDGGNSEERDELAMYIASAFICNESIPCGMCRHCLKIKSGSHPDVLIVDPESLNEKTFKIGAVRDIITDAYILPNEAEHKVYILKNTDKMNVQAQNALLKLIEEPPLYARFIMSCDSRASLLETIMSRVTPFNLGTSNHTFNDGNMQKADDLADKLAKSLAAITELEFMRLSAIFEKEKDLFEYVLSSIQLIFRDSVSISTSNKQLLSGHSDTAQLLASKFSLRTLISLIENTEHFSECIKKNSNKNLLITRFCSVLRNTAYGG